MEGLENVIMTKKRFTVLVEETVQRLGLTHMEAIVHLCEEMKMEVEDIVKYITPVIKDKIEADAMKLNFLEGSNDFQPLE